MTTQDLIRESVASLLHIEATPKAAITALNEHEQTAGVVACITELKALPWNAKAKAKPILDAFLADLDAADAGPTAPTRILEIQNDIKQKMQDASIALIEVGHLLNEAREEFETAKEFIAWAFDNFGFRKAYTYRLRSVADTFGTDDVLKGQSVNVLHKLAAMPEEVKQAARERVEGGEDLTGEYVKRMSQPEPEAEKTTPVDTVEPTTLETTSYDSDLGDTGAPWNPETGEEVELGAAPKAVPPASDAESQTIQQLRETISELQAELVAARQERESKAAGKSKAPMLPQFKSDCMYARLGLSAEQGADAAEVRKAFRALVKAGYNSQHEAYTALVEAKDSLSGADKQAA